MNKLKTILGFIPTLNSSYAISRMIAKELKMNFEVLKSNFKDNLIQINDYYFIFNEQRIIKYENLKDAEKHFKINLF